MIKTNILFIFCTLIFVFCLQQIHSQESYIDKNNFILNDSLTDVISGFDKYKLFVLGERHGGALNDTIFKEFIQYFNKNYGVRHIIIEEGYSRVALMNLYLSYNDTKIYDLLNEYSVDENMDFIDWIKNYNSSLSDSLKIVFHGVDYEQTAEEVLFINLLIVLLPDSKSPKEILPIIQRLLEFNDNGLYSYKECNKLYIELLQSYEQYKDIYKCYYGDNYEIFKTAINRLNNSIELQRFHYNINFDSLVYVKREILISRNILELSKTFPDEIFLAKYGVGHIGLNYFLFQKKECMTFVNILNKSNKFGFNENVATFYIDYNSIRRKCYSKEILGKDLNNIIEKRKDSSDISIIRLDGLDSPYEKLAKEKFQYIITY